MLDVFISYSSKDQKTADAVVNQLEAAKINCWIAHRDADAGELYAASIMRAMKNSAIFLLVFSANSNNSKHVLKEIDAACKYEKVIIPFRIDSCQLDEAVEYYLSSTHWLNATNGPIENYLENLVNLVNKYLKKKATAPVLPESKTETPEPQTASTVQDVSPQADPHEVQQIPPPQTAPAPQPASTKSRTRLLALAGGGVLAAAILLFVLFRGGAVSYHPAPAAFRVISVGVWHTVGIREDGSLWAWGSNKFGQLGDGTTEDHHIPVRIGAERNWASVSAGVSHTVAIRADGSLWAWGRKYAETELFDDDTPILVDYGYSPVQIGADTDWTFVSAGLFHTAAIRADGSLWAWGRKFIWDDDYAQDVLAVDHGYTPVQIGTYTNWAYVSAGAFHTVAIRIDGSLWAWGNNEYGQLGDGTGGEGHYFDTPIQIGTDTNWGSVSAGGLHTVAIRTDGSLWAWGSNDFGQLGYGTDDEENFISTPIQVGTYTDWASVSAGGEYTIAIRADGSLWVWGSNDSGQLGVGTSGEGHYISTPTRIEAGTNWAFVFASTFAHNIAIGTDGSLWAWGLNYFGKLGDGTTAQRNAPVQIQPGTRRASVATGFFHTVVIRTDGSLWAWGRNGEGLLGDGTTTDRHRPIQIGTYTNWASVSAGLIHTAAIRTDGSLWAWGVNDFGQLGDGPVGGGHYRDIPVQIGSDTNWAFVSAGEDHTIAIRTDGSLWAWGRNNWGQLGDGTRLQRSTPVQIGMDTNWAYVSAGAFHTVAIRTDGSLWAWGANEFGQLGDGTSGGEHFINNPIQIGTYTNWTSVSAGAFHTVAIRRTDGSLWAWGRNNRGQLGDGTGGEDEDGEERYSSTPIRVGTGTNWASVSSGAFHTVAVRRTDNSLWIWGNSSWGELGDGTGDEDENEDGDERFSNIPVRMEMGTNQVAMSAGWRRTIVIRTDDMLAWGYNSHSQLGDGTTTLRNTPVQVQW